MKVSPSILAADLANLGAEVAKFQKKAIDYIHIDVMDGHFVPALTFGEQVTQAIAKNSDILLDIHLMVSQPEKEVPKYFSLKPYCITFHYEATDFAVRLAQQIRKEGILAGVAVNPSTPIESLETIYPFIDLILIMTVEPGYYGQSFLENGLVKIEKANKMRETLADKFSGHRPIIEVDGGISDKNIQDIKKAGADMVVAGSFIFKGSDANAQAMLLKE